MSDFRTWALWCSRFIGLLFLIDKVMRLLDRTLLCSFHCTEWGLSSARTVHYFFLSLKHSSALSCLFYPQDSTKLAGISMYLTQSNIQNRLQSSSQYHSEGARDRTRDYKRYDKHNQTLSEDVGRTRFGMHYKEQLNQRPFSRRDCHPGSRVLGYRDRDHGLCPDHPSWVAERSL